MNIDTKTFEVTSGETPIGTRPLPPGMRLVPLRPRHGATAARLMTDCFVAREPMARELAAQRAPSDLVYRAVGQVAEVMMRAAAAGGTSLAVEAADDTLVAVCANYQVGCFEPPSFPAPVGAIGALLGALYTLPVPNEVSEPTLDVGILAVDERCARRGLATHLLQATVACAAAAGFRSLTAAATGVSQDVFAGCGFCSWGHIPYDRFRYDGAVPFAAVMPFSSRFPAPAAHLMGRPLVGAPEAPQH